MKMEILGRALGDIQKGMPNRPPGVIPPRWLGTGNWWKGKRRDQKKKKINKEKNVKVQGAQKTEKGAKKAPRRSRSARPGDAIRV